MTYEEMIAQEKADREKFEAETVGAVLHDGQKLTIATLRQLFDAIADPKDWKSPCAAFVPAPAVEAVCQAVEFYHGTKATVAGVQALTGKVLVESSGYAGVCS